MPKQDDTLDFKGFRNPNNTQVPDELFDKLLPALSGAELKVLLYIIRRTFGFKRESDTISLSQMLTGIQARDGRVLDRGTGLSKPALLQALRSLGEKNIIETERRRSSERGDEPTVYKVKFVEATRGQETLPPVVKKVYQGGGKESLPGPWSKKLTTQYTVEQETVEQDISNIRMVSTLENSQETTDEAMEHPQPKGFRSVGSVLTHKSVPANRDDVNEDRQAILEYISDFARELGDGAKLSSSVTRAVNLYRRSGRDIGGFTSAMYEARSRTKEYTANIKKRQPSEGGGYTAKNKMPYFFGILEQLLGLREDAEAGAPRMGEPEKGS
jgi:hypothetical protein